MSFLFRNNINRLKDEMDEENNKKLIPTSNKLVKDWYSDIENLKRFMVEKSHKLNFIGVQDGKLLYNANDISINNGNCNYRIYEVSCVLSPSHKVFLFDLPHTYIYAYDVVDKLNFSLSNNIMMINTSYII